MHKARGGFAKGWNGVSIRYDSVGRGEPAIVCCNGLGVSTSYWKYIVPYFSRDHQVITWEYRGHYASGRPQPLAPDALTMSANTHDLAAVLDACAVERAVLLGHSMGCQVILEMWRNYPQRVAGLVPVCGPYGRPMDTFFLPPKVTTTLADALAELTGSAPGLLESLMRPFLRSSLPDKIARLSGLIHPDLASAEDMAPYYANLSRMDLEVFFRMAIEMQRHDAGPWLHRIDVPTLVVAGERDTFTPLSLSIRMRDEIPGAELLLLPRGSHAAIIEHPELINLRLEKFLHERVVPFLGTMRSASRRRARPARSSKRLGT